MRKSSLLSIMAVIALGCGCNSFNEAKPDLKYQRSVEKSDMSMLKRGNVSSRPLVFPRSQLKYGLFQNYLDWWIDRPLFFRRSMRKYPIGEFHHMQKESYIREIGIVEMYEVDGLANISTTRSHLRLYEQAAKWTKEAAPEKFKELPEFAFGAPLSDKNYYLYRDTLKTALNSKYSFRLNGKVLITSYVADRWKPEQIKELTDKLKKDVSEEFLFVPDLTITLNKVHRKYLANNNKVSEDADKEFRRNLQAYLNVSDGVYISAPPKDREHNKTYVYHYDKKFVEDYLNPTLENIISNLENKGKLLGLGVKLAYINHRSGINYGEFGTKSLRENFETALKVKPDFLILPEWDEVNENTCFQPTIQRSLSTQRIIKYYMRKLKGEKPTPNINDDLSIPNLIVSYPRTVKLGEPLRFELLNIPDSDSDKSYSAQLTLKTLNGRTVKKFPLEKFIVKNMNAVSYVIPSEELSSYQVLTPVLETVNPEGQRRLFDNLLYVRITPTWRWNYQYVKQPLRDMLFPEKADFAVIGSNNHYAVSGSVKSEEKIISVEVMDNGKEVYGYDKANEFDQEKNIVIAVRLTAAKRKALKGKMTIRNASSFYFRPKEGANQDFRMFKILNDGVEFTGQSINILLRCFYLTIPKKDKDKAVLEFDLDLGKFKVPVKTLVKYGVYGKALPGRVFIRFDKMDCLPDIPIEINERNVSFKAGIFSENKFPVYHMRVITESGKIYRSAPVMPEKAKGKDVKLNVFSEVSGKVETVDVKEDRIPDLDYIFNPSCGEVMRCDFGRFWDAELGAGFKYLGPFNRNPSYPKNANFAAPGWVKEGNAWMLEFDGEGNYINFPRETFPRGSFTLEFDAFPESDEARVLFRHRGGYVGSLVLKLKKGKLFAAFTDMDIKTTDFETGLEMPAGKWSHLKVSYNLKEMRFDVNGKSKSFPFSRRALYFKPAVFGGDTRKEFGIKEDMKFFKGKLKSLRIRHWAE